MKILLTKEEVAEIIAVHYGVHIDKIEWVGGKENYTGYAVNAEDITIHE